MDRVDLDEAELVELVQTLVRWPSEQTDRFEAEPTVMGFVADLVRPMLERWGIASRLDGMGNLLAELGGATDGPSLTLVGYAMTHPAGSMATPFAAERIETELGRAIRGRGIAEQKAPLAAALIALRAMAQRPLAGRLSLLLLTAGETGRHDAIVQALEVLEYVPDHAVVLIGTGGAVALGNKGRLDVDVTVLGEPCHSSQPWRGVDAVAGARRLLDQLDRLPLAGDHPGLGKPSLVCTRLRSFPEATHTLQDEVRPTFDRRLLPGDDPKDALQALARAAELDPPWRIEVEPGPFMHPCELAPDGRLIAAIDAGCRSIDGSAPPRFWSHGALDAGYLQRQGAEATMWGPGDPLLWHRPDEHVTDADLVLGARRYVGLIRALLTASA